MIKELTKTVKKIIQFKYTLQFINSDENYFFKYDDSSMTFNDVIIINNTNNVI